MFKHRFSIAHFYVFLTGMALAIPAHCLGAEPSASKPLTSGIRLDNFSKEIQPGDDFYRYVNDAWMKRTEIPSDQARYGAFIILDENVKAQVKQIIEDVGSKTTPSTGPEQQVGDFYRSYVNVAARNEAGLRPIQKWLDLAKAVDSKKAWIELNGQLDIVGVSSVLGAYIDQDAKRSDQYAVHLTQNGISLPDRDYYLSDEGRYQDARTALRAYMTDMFEKLGEATPAQLADSVLAFEAAIAKVQWSNVELRDPIKTYNKVAIEKFDNTHPNLAWTNYSTANGLPIEGDLIVGQPSFFAGIDKLVAETDLETLKAYTRFRILDTFAGVLDESLEKRHFDFHETALSGVTDQEPLWKRGVKACTGLLGMPVGQLYVARHFSEESKRRMQNMVEGLKEAFAIRIQALPWMSPGTQKQALEKLSLFNHKIGYPDSWKDYSSVVIKPDSVIDNLVAIHQFEHHYALRKLGKPIDRTEWLMPPQMVNAYFNPQMNEIVFPAAILQPPFFNIEADDAVNYGGIGAVIGHEISHGFDDQGSQYDGHGNLRNWWTEQDRKEFEARAEQLVNQYAAYKPFDDMNVNGKLTLGENIGDLGGLNAAYTAYRRSLKGQPAPTLDGFTGDQRFFIGWAQVWLFKYRETELRKRLLTDPHSPAQYRANGILSNLDAFYEAFSIKPNSPMWIESEKRVRIW
ncbi:MAG: M13 family metallopeptidase [Pirellulaceae bacterium]|nr:M13 family metallopeptidase [Pirellulaceae bacterium]